MKPTIHKVKTSNYGLLFGSDLENNEDVIPDEALAIPEFDLENYDDVIPAETLAYGYQPEIVHGTDDRRVVANTQAVPHKAICKLLITTNSGRRISGTGYLVAANKLFTAGHCVYSHDHGGVIRTVTVIPGMNGSTRPYGTFTVNAAENLMSTVGWVKERSARFDMGAIKLPRNVGHRDFITPQVTDVSSAAVVGYPGSKSSGLKQYTHSGSVRQRNGQYSYLIDTSAGQSGGPVLTRSNRAVGIHNKGGARNLGSDLYPEFINAVANW